MRRGTATDRETGGTASCRLPSMDCRVFLVPLLLVSIMKSEDPGAKQSELSQRVQSLMSIQVGFEQMVPAGMSIEAKEVSRKGTSGKDLVVQYHIFVKGVPPNTLFRHIDWPVNADKPISRLEGISVGKDGILVCAARRPEQCGDPKKPDDPIEFISIPRKGEPTRLAFVSQNIRIGMIIVPDPIQAKDKGCTLSAVRLTPKFDLAFLSGTGYPPGSDVHYRVSSDSPEVTNAFTIKADSDGTIRVSVIPFASKKTKGTVTVKVMESTCSPELSYDWGTI
jgi:hypothetical protein